jgi:hypothetical protein
MNKNKKIIGVLIGLLILLVGTVSLANNERDIGLFANKVCRLDNIAPGKKVVIHDLGYLRKGDTVEITSSSWFPEDCKLAFRLKRPGFAGTGVLLGSGETVKWTVVAPEYYELEVTNECSHTIEAGTVNITY